MIRMRSMIKFVLESGTYIWIDAILVAETSRAILIIFDGHKAWIPKIWVAQIKQNSNRSIKIKILDYDWAQKFV